MGKSNLRFAGMTIGVNISIDGLSLLVPTTRQVGLLSCWISLQIISEQTTFLTCLALERLIHLSESVHLDE